MINRGREITQMMGYGSTDATLEAIGQGELILLKVDAEQRLHVAAWLRKQLAAVEATDALLAATLNDMADGLDLAMELTRYPADTDVCELDLPHGWPSYCERDLLK
jgi:hypothetical protein